MLRLRQHAACRAAGQATKAPGARGISCEETVCTSSPTRFVFIVRLCSSVPEPPAPSLPHCSNLITLLRITEGARSPAGRWFFLFCELFPKKGVYLACPKGYILATPMNRPVPQGGGGGDS